MYLNEGFECRQFSSHHEASGEGEEVEVKNGLLANQTLWRGYSGKFHPHSPCSHRILVFWLACEIPVCPFATRVSCEGGRWEECCWNLAVRLNLSQHLQRGRTEQLIIYPFRGEMGEYVRRFPLAPPPPPRPQDHQQKTPSLLIWWSCSSGVRGQTP